LHARHEALSTLCNSACAAAAAAAAGGGTGCGGVDGRPGLDEAVARMGAWLSSYQFASACCDLVAFCSVLLPEQFASLIIAAWPRLPTAAGLLEALQARAEARGRADACGPGGGTLPRPARN
jgi:hypothetical protein